MPRRILNGVVVSDACNKTVVVKVNRRVKHPLYSKFMNRSKKFLAHDEENSCKVGDKVSVIESKPYSKRKCWQVLNDQKSV